MFKINRDANEIQALKKRSFSELGFKERPHLQEWIAKNPSCLNEDLLVIQKEFAGFSDTQERLDLLAIDKQGRLVIIENKLDDTGKDVTWQALKYASYCASLSNENILNIFQEYLLKSGHTEKADELIADFLEVDDLQEVSLNKGMSQRIILVAANFRKEVTSTVLWLLNFKLQVQCFKATPFSQDEELFLTLEQIIPTKDAEEFMIGLADKAQEESGIIEKGKKGPLVRRAFWGELLKVMRSKSKFFDNISAGKEGWIGAGSGVRGVGYNFAATKSYGRAEIYIDRGDHDENKRIFDELSGQKDAIHEKIGDSLTWERLDFKQACRIKLEAGGNINDETLWPDMIKFMTDAMVKMEAAFKDPLTQLNAILKSK